MEKKKYSLLSNIVFYYKKLYEYEPAIVYRQIVGVICSVLLPLFTIYLPKLMLDFVQKKVSYGQLALWLGGFVLLMAVMGGLSNELTGGTHVERSFFGINLQGYLFRKFLRVDYRYAEEEKYREKYWAAIKTNWGFDNSVPFEFFETFPKLIIEILCFVFYSAIIIRLQPAVLVMLIVMSLIHYEIGRKERQFKDQMRPKQDDLFRKWVYVRNAAQSNSAAKDIRIFGLYGWLKKRSEKVIAEDKKLMWKISVRELYKEGTVWFLEALRNFVVYAILMIRAVSGQISPGDFVLYLGAIAAFGDFLKQMIEGLQKLMIASDRACRYREYYDLPEEKQEGESIADLKLPPSIDFCHVTFGYEVGTPIFSDFTLHIDPGEKVALVGVNGAGKTTFVKLLAGFYEPWEGEILINGINADSFAKKERYRLFSAVFQETEVFPFTLAENLTLQPEKAVDKERAISALKEAGIWETLQEKGIGLESRMTKYFLEEGIELSGGQMQRFMLARAIYKDAPVLLLDEPTAALDPIAESEVYDSYAEMAKKKTAIFISHRLASTRFSDRIVLIENGRIVESGTHEEMLLRQGTYAEMFALQASYYRKEEQNHGI